MEEPRAPAEDPTSDPPRAVATFIVRATRAGDGRLTGTVERVRTGERQRFEGNEAIGVLIDRMAAADKDGGPGERTSLEGSP